MSATTTVTLSGAPPSSARSTSPDDGARGIGRCAQDLGHPSSETTPDSPSVHKKVAVAGPRLAHRQVRLHRVDAVDRPVQKVAARVPGGFLGGDLTGVDQALDVGVVLVIWSSTPSRNR